MEVILELFITWSEVILECNILHFGSNLRVCTLQVEVKLEVWSLKCKIYFGICILFYTNTKIVVLLPPI